MCVVHGTYGLVKSSISYMWVYSATPAHSHANVDRSEGWGMCVKDALAPALPLAVTVTDTIRKYGGTRRGIRCAGAQRGSSCFSKLHGKNMWGAQRG